MSGLYGKSGHCERTVGQRSNPPVHRRGGRAGLRLLAMTGGLIILAGCASPEASRTRGGGPGADVKNWGRPVEFHAGAEPYHETPCVTEPLECNGPPPVFGPAPPPD